MTLYVCGAGAVFGFFGSGFSLEDSWVLENRSSKGFSISIFYFVPSFQKIERANGREIELFPLFRDFPQNSCTQVLSTNNKKQTVRGPIAFG